MPGRDVYLCFCLSICALLHVPACDSMSNMSTKDQLLTGVEDPEHTDEDPPLLWLRASLPSYSKPLRPYTLPRTNPEDYVYMPKPRHYRPSRLLRILGSSFDPFWMSIDPPSGSSGVNTDKSSCDALSRRDSLPARLPNDTTSGEDVNITSSELREAAASQRKKLERKAADVDLSTLSPDVATSVRAWLVQSATCGLCSQWVDLGPAFWPRWLRQTDCDKSDRVQSCSFPPGMVCGRAQITHVKILAWHCLKIRKDDSKRFKTDRSDVSMLMGGSEGLRRCLWMAVPYPVVTACTCSCQ
uniref:noggin-1-like n=1 Tax=Doryrhamphus excisus TaxID=161450 RepID=UPI0025AE29C5|nr:noggin-1-like [Doryrhamphus excisus]